MLRFRRRCRFAPSAPCEREHRETRVSGGQGGTGGDPLERGPEGTPGARGIGFGSVENARSRQRTSLEAALSPESREQILQSPVIFDALANIPRGDKDAETILLNAALSQDIPLLPDEDIRGSLWAWHDRERQSKRLQEPDVLQTRQAILAKVTDDPGLLVTLIESLERERKRYEGVIATVERTSTNGKRIGGKNDVLHILTRSDAAQNMLALMKLHGQQSVEQWVAHATPEELRTILDVSDRGAAHRSAINLLQDVGRTLTFGMWNWGRDDAVLSVEQVKNRQGGYFAEVSRNIEGLQVLLKEKLDTAADHLSTRADTELRENLCGFAHDIAVAQGRAPQSLGDFRIESLDDEFRTAFEQHYGVCLQDVTEEMEGHWKQAYEARELSPSDPEFTAKAGSLLAACRNSDHPGIWERALQKAKEHHSDTKQFIERFRRWYPKIMDALRDPTVADRVWRMTGALSENSMRERLEQLWIMTTDISVVDRSDLGCVQKSLEQLMPLLQMAIENPRALGDMEYPTRALHPEEFTESADSAELEIGLVATRLDELRDTLQSNDVCRTFGIFETLQAQIQAAPGHLALARSTFDHLPPEAVEREEALRGAGATLALVRKQMANMSEALNLIATIGDPIPYRDARDQRKGHCDYGTSAIYINLAHVHTLTDEQLVVEHERGHVILDILTERTGVLMTAFNAQREALAEWADEYFGSGGDDELEQLLTEAEAVWEIDRLGLLADGEHINRAYFTSKEELAKASWAYFRRKRFEELLMQYAEYRAKADAADVGYDIDDDLQYSPCERSLFKLLDAKDLRMRREGTNAAALEEIVSDPLGERMAGANSVVTQDRVDAMGENDESDSNTESGEKGDTPLSETFGKLRGTIRFIGEFLKTYPETKGSWIGNAHQQGMEGYEVCFRLYDKHYHPTKGELNNYDPEKDVELRKLLKHMFEELEKVKDAIEKLDGENLKGVADAPSSGRNWWVRISQDVHWVTLMDMGTMGKEAWEDILRLWKRRGENARGKFGEALTGWIPSWIPYASQLKHEFHRRQQDSELASVQVWEKALENVDAYALIESFDRVTIKDQLKATLIRLTKLGRLDWGEVKLWRALNRFSHFNIPKQECQRDPVLLDKYLQKVIADIWGDKDLYRTWKTSNESAYKSNRDAYEGVADDLSAHGLLGSQLKYMLETFVRAKKAGRPISDQVNPHLYEQLVLYAMLKGKMSMQEKFFYLIMGVRHGLIPFERLSILVGQISMETFPFIDYFYGHNNTRKEITEIAESIEEEFNPFKPGVKTTAFLMEEVVRDETARQRVVKFIDRVGNRMDHEDVPTAAAFLRAGSWDKFLIVSSGQLQRVTEEGLKNAYVGFSTLFKSYGIIAEKKAAHGQHFSSSDSRFLAERLIAYMHYDNVVARQATDNTSRPELSYGAIDNETMPSGSNRKPREFRDPMNDLAYAVFSAYRDQIKRFQPREQLVDDEDEPIDFEKYEKMYFAFDENGKRRREIIGKGSAKGKRIHKMTYEMEDAFSAAVQSDGGALLMRILREHKDHLINEGGDENKLSYEVHKDFFGRQKRFTHAPNGSFPHYVAAA